MILFIVLAFLLPWSTYRWGHERTGILAAAQPVRGIA